MLDWCKAYSCKRPIKKDAFKMKTSPTRRQTAPHLCTCQQKLDRGISRHYATHRKWSICHKPHCQSDRLKSEVWPSGEATVISSAAGQPPIGKPLIGQTRGQLRPTWKLYAESPQSREISPHYAACRKQAIRFPPQCQSEIWSSEVFLWNVFTSSNLNSQISNLLNTVLHVNGYCSNFWVL